MKKVGLVGQIFGKLFVVERASGLLNKKGTGILQTTRTRYGCFCECGQVIIVDKHHLLTAHTVSCGCSKREKIIARSHKHGMARHGHLIPEYVSWTLMLQRCTNPKNPHWHNYGGRGIEVCSRWSKFENFLEDMGRKPGPEYSIDRIDNNGPYTALNCRWSLPAGQARNTRRTKLSERKAREIRALSNGGCTQKQLAARYGIPPNMVSAIVRGKIWKLEETAA